ncbi:MAG: hypothetical protein R3C17_08400 [Planctomycetaceae bacterium]
MRCGQLTVCLILGASLVIVCRQITAQDIEAPELVIPPLNPAGEVRPDEKSPVDAGTSARREMSAEASEFIRSVALLLIPQEFEDDNGWGDETKIQSGLNMRFDDGQLRTSRRWKHVNHGNWQQVTGRLVDPEDTFRLRVVGAPDPDRGIQQYDIDVSARLRIQGRQQQWNYGLMLWSISAEAVADVNLHVLLDVKSEIMQSEKGARLRFLPNVRSAEVRLSNFSLRRISHLKGKPVQQFGDWFESMIQRRVSRENDKLTLRINAALQKQPEKLEIPLDIAGLFGINNQTEN